jgi:hypothetical protein
MGSTGYIAESSRRGGRPRLQARFGDGAISVSTGLMTGRDAKATSAPLGPDSALIKA